MSLPGPPIKLPTVVVSVKVVPPGAVPPDEGQLPTLDEFTFGLTVLLPVAPSVVKFTAEAAV
ncbi:hypothetical protein F6R98_11925 [Candidatus Methylospira mobilis]|uniref:Uncharacterized protein n=1 Tax=Candidatus Methylospira mobilis TaxID=1808979 RepID=A0A5Q0BLZ1_9GAMM|nr:hypothetical protein F6R98_11925 [Candidatus Methylospira mobilis]